MNIFEILIMQPIFNILIGIYAILPGHDFGISLIIFTILVRLAMWPLVKKQLHQTKLMRQVQPELKKIKARTKGNKQLETKLMMELYREKGVKPFSSIGLLILQLPIFIALFQVIRIITEHRGQIHDFTYSFIASLQPIKDVIANPHNFNEKLFGIINLTQPGIGVKGIYIPAIILALVAAVFQFIQSRQLAPKPDSNKRLRDILKASATGSGQVDQSEISAIMSNRMALFMPVMLLFIAVYLPSALVLYYAVSSIVAVIQQRAVLSQDAEELVSLADKKSPGTSKRESAAQEAQVVTQPKTSKPKRKKRKRR